MTMVQMPALNTPQFSWVKSRLPKRPQPVPPIFQPEVAAEAILWAAHHDRPGWPTVKAIIGNKIVPRLADRYLARNGYAAQQMDVPAPFHRPDNLWQPLHGDHGAHGEFDDRAHPASGQFWFSPNRHWLSLAGIVFSGFFLAVMATRRINGGKE